MGLNISIEDPTAPSNEEHFLHDLAIPLTTFKLNLDLLQEQYQKNACLHRLRVGFEQIDLMLKDRRSYSFAKISQYKLSQIIAEALALFATNIQKESILIETSLQADVVISKHAVLFKRIIINLLRNSLDAVQQEKKLRKIRIITLRSGKEICLRLYNSGNGFPEEVLPYLGKLPLANRKPGHGVGLIYVNKVINHVFKGRIEFTNPEIGGALVCIYLPL